MKKETDDEHLQNGFKDMFERILGTADRTGNFKENDINENTNMALISYIIPPIPFFVERSSKYVMFHSNQAMNCFLWLIILMIFMGIVDYAFTWERYISAIKSIIFLVYLALCGIGAYNVHEKKAKELPLINKFNLVDVLSNLFSK